jgi:hypothetical protein
VGHHRQVISKLLVNRRLETISGNICRGDLAFGKGAINVTQLRLLSPEFIIEPDDPLRVNAPLRLGD